MSYLKDFTSKSLSRDGNHIHFSKSNIDSFGLKLVYSTLKRRKNTNIGVLLPVYYETKTGKIADTQLSISGSCKTGEHLFSALLRELKEEIGLQICTAEYLFAETIKSKQIHTFMCNLNTHNHNILTQPVIENHEYNLNINDDYEQKIQLVIYGDTKVLYDIMSKITYRTPSTDNNPQTTHDYYIGGIRLVQLESIVLKNFLKKNNVKKFVDKCTNVVDFYDNTFNKMLNECNSNFDDDLDFNINIQNIDTNKSNERCETTLSQCIFNKYKSNLISSFCNPDYIFNSNPRFDCTRHKKKIA